MLARACPKPNQSSSPSWDQACPRQGVMPGEALQHLLAVPGLRSKGRYGGEDSSQARYHSEYAVVPRIWPEGELWCRPAIAGPCQCLCEIHECEALTSAGRVAILHLPGLSCLLRSNTMLQVQASRRHGMAPLSVGFVHTPMWQKLAPLALIFFCATFNHTLLVNMKVRYTWLSACSQKTPEALVHCLVMLTADGEAHVAIRKAVMYGVWPLHRSHSQGRQS